MSRTKIPLEIIDKIINSLQSDIAALSAISRTCHTLLPLCQKNIFSAVDLGLEAAEDENVHDYAKESEDEGETDGEEGGVEDEADEGEADEGEDEWEDEEDEDEDEDEEDEDEDDSAQSHIRQQRIASFEEILTANPTIAEYVRDLRYEMKKIDLHTMIIPSILDKLNCVEKLVLSGYNGRWSTLPPKFQKSLMNRIHLPSLISLHISWFSRLPINLFDHCTALTTLSINEVEKVDKTQAREGAFTKNILLHLRSLSFDVCNTYIPMLLQGSAIPNLETLEDLDIDIRGDTGTEVTKIILSAASNLKTLSFMLEESGDTGGVISALNTTSFATLRTLQFMIFIYHGGQELMGGLCPMLEAFPKNNILDEVEISILLLCCLNPQAGDSLGRLDDTLTCGFPLLSQFSLHIECGEAFMESFDDLPSKKLPQLLKKPSVHLEYEVVCSSDKGIICTGL